MNIKDTRDKKVSGNSYMMLTSLQNNCTANLPSNVPLDWQVESNNVRILVGCNAPNMYVQ
jgi:hypothetical protein